MQAAYLTNWNQLPNHCAYKAQWTPKNAHFQSGLYGICHSKHLSLCQKICLLFKRIFEAIVRFFTPSSFQRSVQAALIHSSTTPLAKIQGHFNAWQAEDTGPFTRHCLDLVTPDNLPIHAFFYARDDLGKRDLPTVIYFQGINGHAMKSTKKLFEFFTGPNVPPCNVIVFDYRASGLNRLLYGERRFTARDLILDGDTVVQAAIHKLKISEKNILFFGVSFGGALATFVAHMYTGRFVNYNSFSSLTAVLNRSPLIREWYELFVLKTDNRCPWTCLRRLSAKRALCMLAVMTPYWGWALEPKDVLPDLQKRILCVNHPNDTVIPVSCAAFNALPPSNRCHSKVIPSMTITDGLALHKAKPNILVTQDGDIPMTEKLTQFLFTQPSELP